MSAFPKGTLEVQRGEVRERGLAPREPGERERVCVCVWMDAVRVRAIRYEMIRGAAPCELGTDKQKGALQ